MEDVLRFFMQLVDNRDFGLFKQEIAQAMYAALGAGFAAHENEVSLVTRLVEATDGKAFGGIRVHSRKIHGSRSYVEFFHRDRPLTKELGDSVYITVVTRGRQRVLQRVCFVQNKVARTGKGVSWRIDDGQLFLLKNFPRLSGSRGIFSESRDVVFKNHGGCLGAYGLFADPGEMVFAVAPILDAMSRGSGTVTLRDLASPRLTAFEAGSLAGCSPFPWLGAPWHSKTDHPMLLEILHEIDRFARHHAFVPGQLFGGAAGKFLGQARFAADIHDFTNAWLLCNLGELSLAFGEVVDPALERTATAILAAAGAGDFFDLNQDVPRVDAGLAVYVVQLDVAEQ